jgi:hypothetical protein
MKGNAMNNGSKTIRMLFVLCAAFFIPRVVINKGADFTSLTKYLFPVVSSQPTPSTNDKTASTERSLQSSESQEPIGAVPPEKIQNQDVIALPLPKELKRAKPTPLKDVLWFGYVPNDIIHRWPYVTAANPELHLQAYRAPFYTGTTPEDLEGVVTYYFGSDNIQKISIRAKTGDFRPLATWLQQYYGFARRETQSPVIYVYEPPTSSRFQKEKSYLWIRPNQAFAEGYDYKKFDVTLVLNSPEQK